MHTVAVDDNGTPPSAWRLSPYENNANREMKIKATLNVLTTKQRIEQNHDEFTA